MRAATDPITVVIQYQAQPGCGERLRRELSALIREVVAREPDCLRIAMHQDADDETRFLLYEEWTSREAYLGPHMRTPHLLAFIERAPAFVAGPPAITFWRATDQVHRA